MKTTTRVPSPVDEPTSLDEMRVAVRELGTQGSLEVDAVRRAFTAGLAPLQTANSASAADFVTRFGGEGMGSEIVRSTAQFGLSTSIVGTIVTPPRPEIDFIEVGDDRAFGVLDSFYTHLVCSLAADELDRVSFLRVMRAPSGPSPRARKPAFSAMMDSVPYSSRTKSTEGAANSAFRVNELGVGNQLTDFIVDDRFTGRRGVVSSGSLRPIPPSVNTNRGSTNSALISIANADRSVLEDVRFYTNQRSMTPVQQLAEPLVVAKRQGLNVLQGSSVGKRPVVIETGNSAGFYEVARLPIASARRVGAYAEIDYWDASVVYGSGYTYYVVAVAEDGRESPRSRMVKVDVVRFQPPSAPSVQYGVIAGRPRFTMSCSGSFLDHVEIFRKGGRVPESVRVLSTGRAMVDDAAPVRTDLGFYHIGDVGLGSDRSAVYVDQDVSDGQALEYRFYAVDSFGAKSQTPFSCSLVLPDHGQVIPLALPSITAEQAPGGRVVNVTVSCDDPRIESFAIGRRELISGELSFRQPSTPDLFTLGTPLSAKRAGSRVGPHLSQFSRRAWLGVLPAVSGVASFQDLSVQFDRTYQYAVTAIDVRGNRTSAVPSRYVPVSVKPVSDAPVSVSGSVITDRDSGEPVGVLLTWDVGTLDFSPNDLIGDQDVLAATSVRSVFQVERREVGRSSWESMPATTSSHFIDEVSRRRAPKYRPPFAISNATYDYRVIAMQSGAYVSTHTDPVRVIVAPDLAAIPAVWLRSTPTALRPIQIAVSWQYNGTFIDGWEVERAVTNKVFGSRIFSMDSAEARGLSYRQIAEVMRESSRGHGISVDPRVDPLIFVGNRFYLDQDVDMANSYFYRVRSFDSSGRFSPWTYAGIALTDSPHDRKFMSALSDEEKVLLAGDPRPIHKWRNG